PSGRLSNASKIQTLIAAAQPLHYQLLAQPMVTFLLRSTGDIFTALQHAVGGFDEISWQDAINERQDARDAKRRALRECGFTDGFISSFRSWRPSS
ncbi:MAG TPA: hypothetical protein VFE47_07730, partial [Tepidisphaeraceae bacterium]|nr:hypothetical protein [Tepidisphaeraceae bacterium]